MSNVNKTSSQNSTPTGSSVGQPVDRQDGRLKVTGGAKYAAEFNQPGQVYAVPVLSAIAKGRIRAFDLTEAKAAPGVLAIYTHENRPPLNDPQDPLEVGMKVGENKAPLRSDEITYNGQYIALVVANTYEQARCASNLVKVDYETGTPDLDMEKVAASGRMAPATGGAGGHDAGQSTAQKAPTPPPPIGTIALPKDFFGLEEVQTVRGTPGPAFEGASHKMTARYQTPRHTHNPIEPHATVAIWQGDHLTVYEATQCVGGPQRVLAGVFGVPVDNVRALCPFTGGGFGTKGGNWPHMMLAAMAARDLKKPVKMALMRQQTFTTTGHRGATVQDVKLAAGDDGKVVSLRHETLTDAHPLLEFFEPAGLTPRMLFQSPNAEIVHKVAYLNIGPPIYMRAPGESVGTYSIDCMMDEMAHELKMDPVQFCVLNHADVQPQTGKPWSSKHLKECYAKGAEMIGWQNRKMEPRTQQQGRYWIGYGMGTATYPGYRQAGAARVRLFADGTATTATAGNDIGTGTYTVLRQVAADALGMPLERVRVELGDSSFPTAPVAGGSQLTASVAPAVAEACGMAQQAVAALAIADARSPLYGGRVEDVTFADGRLALKSDPKKSEAITAVVKRTGKPYVEACARAETMMSAKDNQGLKQSQRPPCSPVQPNAETDSDMDKYAFQSFGAHFCKVRVDEELGVVRLLNWAVCMDVGRVLNPKTARNQIMGGIAFGIGMALLEETPYDPNTGRPTARNLADYHVTSHADAPDIAVAFLDIPDPHINRLGVRGVGEIGITGVAAAIANAIFNATGKRLRDLPLTPDKIMA